MDPEEIDEWLQKVDEISREIKGIASGTISPQQADLLEAKREEERKMQEKIKEIREKEKEDQKKKPREGKGH
jgi:hypothetical protein